LDVGGSVFRGARGDKSRDVFRGVETGDDNTYSLQVTGSVPITNRAARGTYEKARVSKRQAEDRRDKTIAELSLNVRNAIRSASTSRILVESSKQSRALQETNVAAEEKRLKLGVTTSFEVLRVQEDLANAHAQEVQSIIDFQKAMTDVQLAEGIILNALGVEYVTPEPEDPIGFLRSIVPITPKDE
jgi:outer membrane protein TolC